MSGRERAAEVALVGGAAAEVALVSARERAAEVAAGVRDPEMPMLTLADLGVLRGVEVNGGAVNGGAVNGGAVNGGAVNGGEVHGGEVHGGEVHGGEVHGGEEVVVSITPTYTGCPALATMRDDLVHRLREAGFARVEVRIVLDPPWSSDWISERGRAALREAGLSAPGPAPRRSGPIPLTLGPARSAPPCPRCGSAATRLTSEFGATACKALYRCTGCLEPFEHVKEI